MNPTEPHELTELVADLAVVAEAVVPGARLPLAAPPAVLGALGGFEEAWSGDDAERAARTARLSESIAAAGMAFLEGDPLTAKRLANAASLADGSA
jgi:hypothetical protein